MFVAEHEYSGNYNTDENKNNHQYKKQYKIYCNKMKEEGKESVSFDVFLNTTVPLKKEIDNNRKKHLTPVFEKLDNFFDIFEELEKAFNYSLILENNSFKVYEDILKLQKNNFDYNIKVDNLDIPVTETEIIGNVLESAIENIIDIEDNIVSNKIESLELNNLNVENEFREKMLQEDIPRYNNYWNNVADNKARMEVEKLRQEVLNGYFRKRTDGKIDSKVVTVGININTGDVYRGISGLNNNPTSQLRNPKMQSILNRIENGQTNYPLNNCGEYNLINNALNNNINVKDLRIYSVTIKTGIFKELCINCRNLYGNIVTFIK